MIVENNNLVLSIVMATGPFSIKCIRSSQVNNKMYSNNFYHCLLILGSFFQFNVLGARTVTVWGMRVEKIGRRPSFGGVVAGGG